MQNNQLMSQLPQMHETVAFSTADSLTVVRLENIVCCMAVAGYARIYLDGNQEPLLVTKGLNKLETFLPDEFFIRVHHNALVNLMHVRKVLKGEDRGVLLSNGMNVALAERRRSALLNRMRVF